MTSLFSGPTILATADSIGIGHDWRSTSAQKETGGLSTTGFFFGTSSVY
jgi:hypothetical protein